MMQTMTDNPCTPWLERWALVVDGEGFTTRYGSHLLPVLKDGAPAMLKVAVGDEERQGGALMEWYAGEGAARVLAREDYALLMERVTGPRSLANMARSGQDDEATVALCQAAAGLHRPRAKTPPATLVPLARWFRALAPRAASDGGIFAKAHAASLPLLSAPQDIVVLHGDYHHDNVLDGGLRGWLAIDPKGLVGERGFEYANLFRNPTAEIALIPGRLRRQTTIVAREAQLDPVRLLQWILAYAGLGAAWSIQSGHDPQPGLEIAEIAAAELTTT